MTTVLVLAIIFLAVFTQSVAGFGVALVAMGFLPGILEIKLAVPLVALVALTLEIFLVIRYRKNIKFGDVWRVALASIVGVPIGIIFLARYQEEVILLILGWLLFIYAALTLAKVKFPKVEDNRWGIFAGFLAGIFGGAYNISGPPVIVYANMRRWPPLEFKSNLQGFFVINSFFVVFAHGLGGNLTGEVFRYYLIALPLVAAGILLGGSLDRFLDTRVFRLIVLILLMLMGLRLIL